MLRLFNVARYFLKKISLVILGKDIDYINYRNRIEELISRGLQVGKNVFIEDNVFFDRGYPYLISIGDNCSISKHVRIIAHDDTIYKFTGGYSRLGRVTIGDHCFIGERVTILPGVTIGSNVVIAAGSVVNKNIPDNSCVAGVPARVYSKLNKMLEREMNQLSKSTVFNYKELRESECLSEELKSRVIKETEKGICYVYGKGENFKSLTWNP